MPFTDFSKAVAARFQDMAGHGLFRVLITKEEMWENYLSSFPLGSNPHFRQRTEHDCQCCKHFIRAIGGVVDISDNQIGSIWDVNVPEPYQTVANSMSTLIKSGKIDNTFLTTEKSIGVAQNHQQVTLDDPILTWNHFYVDIPREYIRTGTLIGPNLSEIHSTKDVLLRGLNELTSDAFETVLDMISQNSLYKGEEFMGAVDKFYGILQQFNQLKTPSEQELFTWLKAVKAPPAVLRLRNTAIGTLLTDLSDGKDLEPAVASYEAKVAPTNYKRPTALVTRAMISKAEETIKELGFTTALERRFATIGDITINNILFANREAKKAMSVFDEIASKIPEKTQKLDKMEEISIDKFLSDVLPKAESVEVMLENRHAGNLVSLIAPVDPKALGMFKWPNNFSWSYAGELTDSIKERVKNAGGKVDGDFRASLSWHNFDDLDLHLIEPDGYEIYYAQKTNNRTLGVLDVDMNAGNGTSRNAVENITYPTRQKMKEGTYKLRVNNYNKRETIDIGFEVEVEFDGIIYSFSYAKATRMSETIGIAEFKYSHRSGVEMISSLPSTQASRMIWGVPSQTFHKVNVIMLSPNHWDGHGVGNRHYFFMLEGCLNEGRARGFFNEFLTQELDKHRKVFEIVGAKMKTEESDRQLSGLGFSSTQHNHLLCRIKGSFDRTVKIVF